MAEMKFARAPQKRDAPALARIRSIIADAKAAGERERKALFQRAEPS